MQQVNNHFKGTCAKQPNEILYKVKNIINNFLHEGYPHLKEKELEGKGGAL